MICGPHWVRVWAACDPPVAHPWPVLSSIWSCNSAYCYSDRQPIPSSSQPTVTPLTERQPISSTVPWTRRTLGKGASHDWSAASIPTKTLKNWGHQDCLILNLDLNFESWLLGWCEWQIHCVVWSWQLTVVFLIYPTSVRSHDRYFLRCEDVANLLLCDQPPSRETWM